MIINDLQRLRWQILDEALRDPEVEYFMGECTKNREEGNTRSLIRYVNQRLKTFNRDYSCSKRMLQNDVTYFKQHGARLEERFRRGHKRILRYMNLEWRNPLLRPAKSLYVATSAEEAPITAVQPEGPTTNVSLRITGDEKRILEFLQQPTVLQRQADVLNGSITIQVEMPLSDTAFALLLGMGADAEVLAPSTLRDRIKQTVIAMQKIYKKDSSTPKTIVQGDLFEGLM